MNDLLGLLLRESAEELHLRPGRAPCMTKGGQDLAVQVAALSEDDINTLLASIAGPEQKDELSRCGTVHFIHVFQSGRLGIEASREAGKTFLFIRNLGAPC